MTTHSTEVRELPVNDAPQGGGGNGNIDLLEGVSLRYFTATPTALGPFDSSVLSWHVDGVKSGVRVLLDTATVAAVSQSTVQPPHSTPFFLSAAAGSARKALGTVTVTVDETTCKETEILNAFFFMRNQLIAQINGNPQTYWSGSTDDPNILSVVPVDGRISVRMVFRFKIPDAPDLWITIEALFGLAVQGGQLVATDVSTTGSAEWPTWFWFLSGILGGLALAFNDANEQATVQAHAVVTGLVQFLNSFLIPDQGKRVRSVKVGLLEGRPAITFVQCAF